MKHFTQILWVLALTGLQPAFSTPVSTPPTTTTTTAPAATDGSAGTSNDFKTTPNGTKVYGSRIFGFSAESSHTKGGRPSGQTTHEGVTKTTSNDGWCSDSTMQNAGSDNSPLISDCQVAMEAVYNMVGNNNSYFGRSECGVGSSGTNTCYFPVVQYESCLFGASTVSSGSSVSVRIGWQDVGDLINSSIAQFGNNPSQGKVGTLGQMNCPEESTGQSEYATAWGLYHS